MKFKIQCNAIKEYDAEKDAYVRCNKEIDVDSSQIGSLLKCPLCGNDVEVSNPNVLSSTQPNQEGEVNPVSGNDDFDILGEQPKSAPIQKQDEVITSSEEEAGVVDLATEIPESQPTPPAQPAAPLHDPNKSQSPASPSSALNKESPSAVTTPVLAQTSFGRTNSCHKCGTLLEEKQSICPNCKADRRAAYVNKGDRKAFSKVGPFGFQLWLASITNSKLDKDENTLFTSICYVVSILLMGGGLAFVLFAGVAGFFIGTPTVIGGYSFFVGLQYWGKTKKDPRAKMPILGQVYWSIMLFVVRKFKISKFVEEKVLDKNGDEDFGDADLAQMRDIAKYKAIDLDGTSVTDEGLLYLYNVRGIQYLVVRNSKVTSDGAHDLQQTIPKTWIWF